MKRLTGVLLALMLTVSMIVPHNVQAASAVKMQLRNGTMKTYNNKKSYVYINGKKINCSKVPIFMKEGAYMGAATKVFKNSSLKVTKKNSGNKLTLSYRGNTLTMTENSRKAVCNGEAVTLAAAPIKATYKISGLYRWIVPIKSVCWRLGIEYKLSNGKIYLTGKANAAVATTEKKQETTTSNQTQQTNKSEKPIILVLDAGHGGVDSGATGNGLKEKNLNLAIIRGAKQYFDKDSRFKVYYTRTSDTYPSLDDRCVLANKKDADLFLSVHINSASASANGTETLYNKNRLKTTEKNGINSLEFATAMQKAVIKTTGFRNRGLVNRTGLRGLNQTKMPACLIEYGFISNAREAKTMNANTARYGKELYQAIVNFMRSKNKI